MIKGEEGCATVNNLDPLIAENKVETVPADIDANSNDVKEEETETD